MKAAQYLGARKVDCREIPEPQPGPGEVAVRIAYCGICGTDLHIFHGHMDRRVTPPQAVGHEASGRVAAVGPGVEGWNIGDPVTVRPLDNCGECGTCRRGFTHICEKLRFLGIETPGAFAERWIVPARLLHRLPEGMDLRLAALVEPLAVACHDVRIGDVRPGESVVVNGGGPIGMLVALAARKAGGKVTIVEINPFRLELAASLGFATLNPTETDAAEAVRKATGGSGADAVFEVSGSKPGALAMTAMARPRGRIVIVAIYPEPVPVDLHKFFWKELELRGARVYEKEDFDAAIALAASGELPLETLISKEFPLEELGKAFEYAETARDAMKILIKCTEE